MSSDSRGTKRKSADKSVNPPSPSDSKNSELEDIPKISLCTLGGWEREKVHNKEKRSDDDNLSKIVGWPLNSENLQLEEVWKLSSSGEQKREKAKSKEKSSEDNLSAVSGIWHPDTVFHSNIVPVKGAAKKWGGKAHIKGKSIDDILSEDLFCSLGSDSPLEKIQARSLAIFGEQKREKAKSKEKSSEDDLSAVSGIWHPDTVFRSKMVSAKAAAKKWGGEREKVHNKEKSSDDNLSLSLAWPLGSENSQLKVSEEKSFAISEQKRMMANSMEKSSEDDISAVSWIWPPDMVFQSEKVSAEEAGKNFLENLSAFSGLSDDNGANNTDDKRSLYDTRVNTSGDDRSETTEYNFEAVQELFNEVIRKQKGFEKGPKSTGKASGSTLVPPVPQAEYDVFISYKKEHTGSSFISHLFAALSRKGIHVFEEFDESFPEDHSKLDAIQKSRVFVIILSKNYLVSCSCLNGLAKILEYKQKNDQMVFPVFYRVSPSDLTNESENFGGPFERQDMTYTDQMRSWRAALKETARMPGYILADRSESELIDEIVRDVSKTLCSNDNENLIGIDSQVEQLLSLLYIQSPDARSIGIWGIGGIGKTAIAREIFHRLSGHYDTSFFLEDIHGTVKRKGRDRAREEFLSQILDVETHVIRTSDIKTSFLRSRLQQKRILVVLDNVNNFRDVETLVGKLSWFGPGSRIVITSRDRRVFICGGVNYIYEVKPLDFYSSLLLFCRFAFRSNPPLQHYWMGSLQLVKFANGNPLALQEFGSSLSSSLALAQWCFLSKRFLQILPNKIQATLSTSYDELDGNEKIIFLDIASFFRGMDKDEVAKLLDACGFFGQVGISNLVDKSLITISDNLLDMHNLIQAMGREIVCQESIEQGKRSRLWNPEDIRDVFICDAGTAAIEGIFLDMSELTFDANPTVFKKMHNLRLLKFYCSKVKERHEVSFGKGLEYLPSKLRLLHWENYPLSSLPRNFDPKNLVEINLPNSRIQKLWKGTKSLEKLKKMRLSYSLQLTKIPRLSRAQNLEHIDLEGCKSLVKISPSICYLKGLVSLNLKGCSKLRDLPSMLGLESLEVLNLSGCPELEKFPEMSPNVKELYLGGTAILKVPSSIKNLVRLQKLDLQSCASLHNLPTTICKLKYLEILDLSGCSSLERFPELSTTSMKSLRVLDLSMTPIKHLPSSISYLIALEELRLVNCSNLAKLPDNVWSLKSLRKVEFRRIEMDPDWLQLGLT